MGVIVVLYSINLRSLTNTCNLQNQKFDMQIKNLTIACLVAWPLNGSEGGGDLVLIQTSLLLLCKSSFSYAN